MEWKLLQQERNKLIALHKRERDKRRCDRIKAVLLYDKGYNYQQIAEILLLDDETIRRHIDDYISKQKLATKNGGSQSNLSEDQAAKLIVHLETNTYMHAKDICAYVAKEFTVRYTVSGMIKWLHDHQFCYKKPHGVPAKADSEKQEAFIQKHTELKSSLKPDEIILFCDSTHPQHQTKLSCGWIKKGIRKSEKMTACQKRVNIIGALDLTTHHLEYRQVDWANGESLKVFMLPLCDAYLNVSVIHLILDNAGYHRGEEFLKFIAPTKIKLHYLPPYSPNLNPIERLWKVMHEQVTYNRYYTKLSEFTAGILGFFENITEYKSIV